MTEDYSADKYTQDCPDNGVAHDCSHTYLMWWPREKFDGWLSEYRESVIDEVEDHLVRRDQFTERTLTVIDELREQK